MATISTSPRDVEFSRDELLLLAKSLKDERFRELLGEFAKEISDPKNQKHYEREVKKWEKQRGIDVVFVDPSPGFVIGEGGGGNPVCVNICSSDTIQKPSFVRAKQDTTLGHNWSIPHAVTKPRNELVSGNKQLLREFLGFGGAKRNPTATATTQQLSQDVVVLDVVFHPDALQLALSDPSMRQTVIDIAVGSVSQNYQLKIKNPREIAGVKYVGKPMKSVIKRVVDKELHDKSDKLRFSNKGHERTSDEADKQQNKRAANQSTNDVEGENNPATPKYIIKHVNKVDLQDFALQLIPQSGPALRPQGLEVEVHLPGVLRASQIEAEVYQQSLNLSTTTSSTTPQYKLELPLPYAVDEETSTARFDNITQKLTFVLAVLPANKLKDHIMPLSSPSSDSGIECESGYRTNSDGDNSSEVSVSSQEELGPRDDEEEEPEDDESSVFESAPSSPIKASLIPSYTLKQKNESLVVILHCGNVLPSSVDISQSNSKQRVNIHLTTVGGGQTPLNYGLMLITSPHDMTESSAGGVSHKINDDTLEVTIRKAKPGPWEACQIGHGKCLATVTIPQIKETLPAPAQPTKEDFRKHGLVGERSALQHNVGADANMTRKPRVTRAVSMCEENSSLPGLRLKGPTCSWPRGILKRRSRSLSESQLGCVLPLECLMAPDSPLELELLEDRDREEEESAEEGSMAAILGEKKSVRFNDVVCRQVFRSNSSILGQRAKNQKKALKKQKCRERNTSESDRDSDASQCHSDPGPSSADLTTTTTTDEEEEDTDVAIKACEDLRVAARSPSSSSSTAATCNGAFIEIDLDVENNNSLPADEVGSDSLNNNNNNNGDNEEDAGEDFVVKSKKKRRNKNKKKKNKKFEPSNSFIFQLDIEP